MSENSRRLYTTFATSKSPVGDTALLATDVVADFLPEIQDLLKRQGFTGVTRVDEEPGEKRPPAPERALHRAAKALSAPVLQACYENGTVYIIIPKLLTDYYGMSGISPKQVKFCEKHLGKSSVYYAALLNMDTEDGSCLAMTECTLIRTNGEWLQETRAEQFLPFELRDGVSYAAALLGPASYEKYVYLMHRAGRDGKTGICQVKGLFTRDDYEQSDIRLYHAKDNLNFFTQVKLRGEEDSELQNTWFNLATPAVTDVEILEENPECEGNGLLSFIDGIGTTFCAACPEAAIMPHCFSMGQRLRGNLNLIATRIANTGKKFTITSGPVFELEKERYREENGCEPPEDFAVPCSTMKLRKFSGSDDDNHATVTGEVKSVDTLDLGFTQLLHITLLGVPDNDDLLLNIFLRKELLNGFRPKAGDNITCSGYLEFTCSELVETDESWVDSEDVALSWQEEEQMMKEHDAFNEYEDYSLAMGIVASSIISWGWEIESGPCTGYLRTKGSFIATKPDGKRVFVMVDEGANGHDPALAYTPQLQQELRETHRQLGKGDMEYIHCLIRTSFNDQTGWYSFEGAITPDIGKELRTSLYTKGHYPPTTLVFNEDGTSQDERVYPEVLDETKAAERYNKACMEGDWHILAKWVRDDATFVSGNAGTQLHSKEDCLRHFAEMVHRYRESGAWEDYRCGTGTIPYQGERRPCSVLYRFGEPVSCMVFQGKDGLIGGMAEVTGDALGQFIPNAKPEQEPG